MDKTYTITG